MRLVLMAMTALLAAMYIPNKFGPWEERSEV